MDLPFIETVGTSAGWKAWSETTGGPHDPQLLADSFGMALNLAAQGHGVALVSELLATHALQAGILERAHPNSIPSKEGYYLSIRDGDPTASQFRDWLLGRLRKDAADHRAITQSPR